MGRMRNRRPDLSGVLVVDKPLGVSSAHVCAVVRRATGGAKVGHAGTLDPLATGVLVLCLGDATRAVELIMQGEKTYLAEVDLAHFSPTDDLEGAAEPVTIAAPPSLERVRAALGSFVGEIEQRPPVYSAAHVGGERAYKTARRAERAGETAPERPPARRVRIHDIELVEHEWPRLVVRVRSGKGVYIRSLARDLGNALGTGGRLLSLRRLSVGPYGVDAARTLEAIRVGVVSEDLAQAPAITGSSSGSTGLSASGT